MHIIVGLGNPGEEYENTRHNAGRMAVEYFAKKNSFPEFVESSKYSGLISKGELTVASDKKAGKKAVEEKVLLLLPETFMNKSGSSLKEHVTGPKKAEKLIVIQDDLDMPIGKIKILFNRGSGGHKGIESIQRALKTEAFVRIKIGICPTTPTGKLKKPAGDKLLDFIVGEFKPTELVDIKKVAKTVADALTMLVTEGREKAMGQYN